MNWLKFGILAAAIAAAGALLAKVVEEKKDEELDDYLMNDPETETVIVMPETAGSDKAIWLEMEEEALPVTVFYKADSAEDAEKLQQELADAGINSNSADGKVEALYLGGEEEAEALEKAATLPGIHYEGFQTAN